MFGLAEMCVAANDAFVQGFASYQSHQYSAAIRLFQQGLQSEPNNWLAHYYLGEALWKDTPPSLEKALYHLTIAALTLAKSEERDRAVEGIAELSKSLKKQHEEVANALERAGRTDEAINELGLVIQLDAYDPRAYSARCGMELESNKVDLAIEDCDRAIRLNPKDGDALMLRAAARLRKGQIDLAIRDCDDDIRLGFTHAAVYYTRAISYYRKGQFNRAIQDIYWALKLNPKLSGGTQWRQAILAKQHETHTPAVAEGKQYTAKPGQTFRDCAECPEMVVVPAGSFIMGSPESEPYRLLTEGPQHQVTIPHPFAVGKYEVTFDEWDACVRGGGCSHNAKDPFGWGRGRRPVIDVSWNDAKEYTAWLSRKTGKTYRLLSEAEWEYAARAGTTTAFAFGDRITMRQANYGTDITYAGKPTPVGQGKTVEVGSYQPNAFGLYDMHGNALEWTEDCWNDRYNGAPMDGSAWTAGECSQRVLRGGSWDEDLWLLRSAWRTTLSSADRGTFVGLRVAKTINVYQPASANGGRQEPGSYDHEDVSCVYPDGSVTIDWGEYCRESGGTIQ